MSRFQRVVHSVGSSYVVLAANILFTLISVPLSLHYLSEEEFGLWAVITQTGSFFLLLEMGMAAGVGRSLFDYRDDTTGKGYGEVISTGSVVLTAQGVLVLILGWLLAPLLSRALSIPLQLDPDFVRWMRWQCVITAAGFMTRIFWHLLAAHHRYDITNYAQAVTFVVNFAVLWALYALGWKLAALVVASAICWALNGVMLVVACVWLRVFPSLEEWWRPSWQRFKEMFVFARDAFLVAIGVQLVLASQTLVVSRNFGLDAAATWAVCSKAFTLVSMMVWRLSDFSASAFVEMIVRKEHDRLRDRFKTITMLTASISVFSAVMFAMANEPFVAVWTAGKMHWSKVNDCLLGAWLIVVSIVRCHTGLVLLTKQVHFLRFVYLIEGLCFLGISELVVKQTGFPGMLTTSVICSLGFSGAYGVWRTRRFFNLTLREILIEWLAPMGRLAAVLLPWSGLVWVLLRTVPGFWQLGGYTLLVGGVGVYLVLRVGLSRSVQNEIAQRAPKRISPILKRILAVQDSA